MAGNLQPLDQQFAIVDNQGRPTRYFIQWAQQKQIDIQDSATEADLQLKVAKIGDIMSGELIVNMGSLATQPFSGQAPGILIQSPSGAQARFVLDAFGAGSGPHYYGRMARLSGTTPAAIQTGDPVVQFSGIGYGTTGYSSGPRGQLRFEASENWSDTSQGVRLSFRITPNGTTTLSEGLSVENDGTTVFHGLAQLNSYATGSLPAAGVAGRIAYDSTAAAPKFDNGTTWSTFGGGGGSGLNPYMAVPAYRGNAGQVFSFNNCGGHCVTIQANCSIKNVVIFAQVANGASQIRPAIYSIDGSGNFNALLAQGTLVTGATYGINTFALTTPLVVTKGQVLWVCVQVLVSNLTIAATETISGGFFAAAGALPATAPAGGYGGLGVAVWPEVV